MSSKIGHSIKGRNKANDVFITPLALAKSHIDMIEYKEDDLWLDDAKNSGSYYNQFPTNKKNYCEILDNKDFFDYQGNPQIIIGNPPYSILDKWFKKVIEINPRVYSCLIGMLNLTPRRIKWFNDAGYGLKKLRIVNIHEWFGRSYICVFEKGAKNCIEFDLLKYHSDK
jgi:hypothetical protein